MSDGGKLWTLAAVLRWKNTLDERAAEQYNKPASPLDQVEWWQEDVADIRATLQSVDENPDMFRRADVMARYPAPKAPQGRPKIQEADNVVRSSIVNVMLNSSTSITKRSVQRFRPKKIGGPRPTSTKVDLIDEQMSLDNECPSITEIARAHGLEPSSPAYRRIIHGKPEHDNRLVGEAISSLEKAYISSTLKPEKTLAFMLIQLWLLLAAERHSKDEFLRRRDPNAGNLKAGQALSLNVRVPPSWWGRYDVLSELRKPHAALLRRAGIVAKKIGKTALAWTVESKANDTWADTRRKNARAMLALLRATGFKLRRRKSGATPSPDDIRQHLEFPDEGDFAPPYGPAVLQEMEWRLQMLSARLDFESVPDIDDVSGEVLPLAPLSPEDEKEKQLLKAQVRRGYDLLNAYAGEERRGRKKGKKNRHN